MGVKQEDQINVSEPRALARWIIHSTYVLIRSLPLAVLTRAHFGIVSICDYIY